MTEKIGQIGYNPSSLFNAQDILKIGKLLDVRPNVSSIWIPESWGREAFVMLGAIATITEKIKLGTSIVSMFSRTPATLAMAASTLDNISSNRTIIGIGASTPVLAENWHGVRFEHPLRRMREYLMCFKIISRAETINFDGEFFRLKNMRILHPSSRKRIPVYLGAVNSGMIKLAAEEADGIILYLRPLDEIKKQQNSSNQYCPVNLILKSVLYLSRRFQTSILIWHAAELQRRWHFMWLWVNTITNFCPHMDLKMK
jgi:5,10-methylenetetrahydromethanopterin reductase